MIQGFKINYIYLPVCLLMCVSVSVFACHSPHVEVRGQLMGDGSLPFSPPRGT